jgi:hypothetical protein
MEAQKGDRITVESNKVGGGTRTGEVVEVTLAAAATTTGCAGTTGERRFTSPAATLTWPAATEPVRG